jgi:hypothetical protein
MCYTLSSEVLRSDYSKEGSAMKSRKDLTVYYQNEKGLRKRCGLCGKNVEEDGHHPKCVFHDPAVTHVALAPMKAQVTLSRGGVWVSPSGKTYRIRKKKGGYYLKEKAVGAVTTLFPTLNGVRLYIEANQGIL